MQHGVHEFKFAVIKTFSYLHQCNFEMFFALLTLTCTDILPSRLRLRDSPNLSAQPPE